MPDHFCPTSRSLRWSRSPFAAEATTQLRVGMLVLDNDYKHPAIVPRKRRRSISLSDGRLEFGLGAGWMRGDYDALGLPYDRPGMRIDRSRRARDREAGVER